MAGLPIALIGFNFIVAALMLVARNPNTSDWTVPTILSSAGILSMIIGLLLRGGRGYLLPIASMVSIPILALQIAFLPTMLALVPIMALLLAISGLRGWLWLRSAHRT